MRTDPDILQTKNSNYEQQILDQKFELARLKKHLDIQELKLSLLHEICPISTGTFEIDSLLDSYMEMIMKAIKVTAGSLLLIDPDAWSFSLKRTWTFSLPWPTRSPSPSRTRACTRK